jgi:hypothetical protein
MLRKLSVLAACAALALSASVASTPAYAAGQWYFVRVCAVYSQCGYSIDYYGPYASYSECMSAREAVLPWSDWPYALSGCSEW